MHRWIGWMKSIIGIFKSQGGTRGAAGRSGLRPGAPAKQHGASEPVPPAAESTARQRPFDWTQRHPPRRLRRRRYSRLPRIPQEGRRGSRQGSFFLSFFLALSLSFFFDYWFDFGFVSGDGGGFGEARPDLLQRLRRRQRIVSFLVPADQTE